MPREVPAILRLVDRVHELLMCGNRVAVHCHAGIGRTGILLACLAIRHCGMDPRDAVAVIRAQVLGAVQLEEQIKFLGVAWAQPLPPLPLA